MELRAKKRIQKELETFSTDEIFKVSVIAADIWHVSFTCPSQSIFSNESYVLHIRFTKDYPMDSPEVMFTNNKSPEHPHIYSNGHICLNILGDDWTPALTVKSICLSIYSMLTSCTLKGRPPDDLSYSLRGVSSPKKTKFVYHDDSV